MHSGAAMISFNNTLINPFQTLFYFSASKIPNIKESWSPQKETKGRKSLILKNQGRERKKKKQCKRGRKIFIIIRQRTKEEGRERKAKRRCVIAFPSKIASGSCLRDDNEFGARRKRLRTFEKCPRACYSEGWEELRFPPIEDRSSEAGYAKASLIACVLWVNAPRTATRSALIVSGVGSRTV